MMKTDNYGARVKIENIMEGEVDEDLLFALLTRLVVKDEVLDMDVMRRIQEECLFFFR